MFIHCGNHRNNNTRLLCLLLLLLLLQRLFVSAAVIVSAGKKKKNKEINKWVSETEGVENTWRVVKLWASLACYAMLGKRRGGKEKKWKKSSLELKKWEKGEGVVLNLACESTGGGGGRGDRGGGDRGAPVCLVDLHCRCPFLFCSVLSYRLTCPVLFGTVPRWHTLKWWSWWWWLNSCCQIVSQSVSRLLFSPQPSAHTPLCSIFRPLISLLMLYPLAESWLVLDTLVFEEREGGVVELNLVVPEFWGREWRGVICLWVRWSSVGDWA